MKLPAWLATVPDGDREFISAGLSLTGLVDAPVREAPRALAAAIGKLAMARLGQGLEQDPAAIDANYVRRSDAELMWKESSILSSDP
jgi:tRNA threonylcarbamoyladenosine biosynthesis protein TsaB